MQNKIIGKIQNGMKLFTSLQIAKGDNPEASFGEIAEEATQRIREEERIQWEKNFKPIENPDAIRDALKKLGSKK